jgi:rhodanese-related sulfurtransferase
MLSSSKKSIIAIIFSLGCFGCFAQAKTDAYHLMLKGLLRHTVREITVQQLAIRPENTILLDAREPEEFAISHIKGAVSVGFDHFDPAKWRFLPQNSPIVVYCSVGYRSEKITEQLLAAGYSNVSNLYGGIFEWINEGLVVENDIGATNRVHAYSPAWGIWLNKGEKVY